MKRNLTLFSRQTFLSESDGNPRTYRHAEKLCELLGSAGQVLLYLKGDRRSSSDTAVTIRVYQGADPDNRPADAGELLEGVTMTLSDLRPAPIPVTGPFLNKLDITVSVEENVVSPANQQEFDFTLYAVLVD